MIEETRGTNSNGNDEINENFGTVNNNILSGISEIMEKFNGIKVD
jgi:hypothetical protein